MLQTGRQLHEERSITVNVREVDGDPLRYVVVFGSGSTRDPSIDPEESNIDPTAIFAHLRSFPVISLLFNNIIFYSLLFYFTEILIKSLKINYESIR